MWSRAETKMGARIQHPLHRQDSGQTHQTHGKTRGDFRPQEKVRPHEAFPKQYKVLGPFSCPPLAIYIVSSCPHKDKNTFMLSLMMSPFGHKCTIGKEYVQVSQCFHYAWKYYSSNVIYTIKIQTRPIFHRYRLPTKCKCISVLCWNAAQRDKALSSHDNTFCRMDLSVTCLCTKYHPSTG